MLSSSGGCSSILKVIRHGTLKVRPPAKRSGLQANLKFWPTSEAPALASGAALANVEALANVKSSGQQTNQPVACGLN